MSVQALTVDFDNRIKTHVVTARSDYRWYLDTLKQSEIDLSIQRNVIKSRKSYQTLRADLVRGCILPPIVLAAHNIRTFPNHVAPENVDDGALAAIGAELDASEGIEFQIIDGLQRTNALRESRDELSGAELDRFLNQPLRIEFWINIKLFALAYRMLLLNAGQKPMSMRHQQEILSSNMESELSDISGIDIIRTLDKRRRVHSGQFQLSKLAQAFQAWLQGQPNIDTQNVIAEQLLAENAVEVLGQDISTKDHAGA